MDTETVNIDGVLKSVRKKLGETYQFIRHLGGGEFSNVYLVKHKTSGQDYALKILDYHYLLQRLKKEDLPDAQRKFNEIKKRFITEARLYKKIHHANIVTIHDAGVIAEETKGIEIPYIITPYIRGASLAEVIKREAPLEINRVIHISQNVLHALEKIYQNRIIHRDLKPANIMIEEATGEAIIIDFGIAKEIIGGTRLTTTGALLGSPMYIAPEQTIDSSSVGPATDIYSFGVVLYEMLTGEPPFKGNNFLEILNAHREKPVPNVKEKNPRLPGKMTDIIYKTMAKAPQERYQHPRDLLTELENALSEPLEPAKPPETTTWFKKYYLYLFLAAVIGIILVLLLKPFGNEKKRGKEITTPVKKETKEEITTPAATPETIAKRKLHEMKQNYETLKRVISGEAGKAEKIGKCQAFLNRYQPLDLTAASGNEKAVIEAEVNKTMAQLKSELEVDTQYEKSIKAANEYAKNHQYEKALEALIKAKGLKDTAEVNQLVEKIKKQQEAFDLQNGEIDYQAIKEKIDLVRFLGFKAKYPGSIHLPDLQERLKTVDKKLPPEVYWDSLKKNNKGYYESVFGKAASEHLMIYIPGKRIWVDKYEVSNLQYRAFLAEEKIGLPPKKESRFIHSGDRYPAVVSYEDAESYCKKYGFRLPTIAEWEYAAGKGIYTYPWGNEAPGAKGTWPANFDSLGEEGKEERDGFTGTAPVNSFAKFSSPYGLVNMAGNVWEWVQGRILKGGSFLSGEEDLMIKNDITGSRDDTQGFRCVKEEK
jgi:serine/threonine protein kinase